MGPLFEGNALGPDIWCVVVVLGLGAAGILGMRNGGIESWARKLIALAAAVVLVAFYWQGSNDPLIKQTDLQWTWCLLAAGGIVLGVGAEFGWIRPRQALIYTGLFLSGCAFYFYMPIAAATNPPMNWGYAATKEGFLHAITRGQYEKITLANPFSNEFFLKIKVFALGLAHQYSWLLFTIGLLTLVLILVWLVYSMVTRWEEYWWLAIVWTLTFGTALLGLIALQVNLHEPLLSTLIAVFWAVVIASVLCALIGSWLYLHWPGGSWLVFVWAAFIVTSFGLLAIINPKLDRQEQEITIKFFAPAHGFFAMLIGYGFALLLGFLLWLRTRLPRLLDYLSWAAYALLAAVPVSLYLLPRTPWGHAWLADCRDTLQQVFGAGAGVSAQHALLAACVVALVGAVALWQLKRVPRLLVQLTCCGLLALPLITYVENWRLCALGTHDYGYQFGYRMFCPGGDYPDMEKDAVLYGGTDPGRFVPTYMIFCESRVKPQDRFRDPHLPGDGSTFDRRDVYIITQNALADNTYMSYIRDHYDLSRPNLDKPETIEGFEPWRKLVFAVGWTALDRAHNYPKDPIRIPTPDDSTKAFQQFVEDWKAGKAPPGADLKIENGRVQVTGVQAVMAINGILAKWIFDWNKEKHSFYVEESYVIPWMYPYLRPAGVIMKIDKEQLPAPQQDRKLWDEIVAKDKRYWDTLTTEFTAREDFRRNNDAKKSFSKMRSAIAGLYLWRGMLPEAEYAFRQSLRLCPESPEGCFRLADLYMNQHRFADARKLMTDYLAIDEYNNNVRSFLGQIDTLEKCDTRRAELQKKDGNRRGSQRRAGTRFDFCAYEHAGRDDLAEHEHPQQLERPPQLPAETRATVQRVPPHRHGTGNVPPLPGPHAAGLADLDRDGLDADAAQPDQRGARLLAQGGGDRRRRGTHRAAQGSALPASLAAARSAAAVPGADPADPGGSRPGTRTVAAAAAGDAPGKESVSRLGSSAQTVPRPHFGGRRAVAAAFQRLAKSPAFWRAARRRRRVPALLQQDPPPGFATLGVDMQGVGRVLSALF